MMDYLNQTFGPYRLIRELNQGSYGKVYLGEHIHLGTYAAIKILHGRLEKEEAKKFREEARTLATLTHDNIAKVLDFNIQNDIPFLVMDYAPKGSLRNLHPKGTKLPLDTIVSYVNQIADALQYAHEHKVVHRDIKPANILLGNNDKILLCDFGIAVIVSGSHKTTQGITGTAAYMAPEQINGKPGFASDQYSLGVVVYEWLCGELPFNGMDVQIGVQHVITDPPSLREKVPTIPPAVEIVVLTALKKEPTQRYGSVKGFADALEQAYKLSSPPSPNVLPSPPSSVPVSPVPSQQRPIKNAQNSPAPLPRNPAEFFPPGSHPGSPSPQAQPVNGAGQASRPVVKPASSPLKSMRLDKQDATSSPSGKRGVPRRTALEIIAGVFVLGTWSLLAPKAWPLLRLPVASTPVPTHTPTATPTHPPVPTFVPQGHLFYTFNKHNGAVNAVAWPPTNEQPLSIVSASSDGTVQKWIATTGNDNLQIYPLNLIPVDPGLLPPPINDIVWSPVDDYIAFCSRAEVHVWHPQRGHFPIISLKQSQVNALAWSPPKNNTQYLVSASADAPLQVWQWSWDSRKWLSPLVPAQNLDVNALAWSPDGKYIASGSKYKDDTIGNVQVWSFDGKILELHNHFNAYNATVNSVAWSPLCGKHLVAFGSDDGFARVWDADRGDIVTYYKRGDISTPDGVSVLKVAWSPDGEHIVSSYSDGQVHIWKPTPSQGTLTSSYTKHTGPVKALGWSPDKTMIASGGEDKTVQIWASGLSLASNFKSDCPPNR
jgi:serine/threonine protein kinase